MSNCIPATGHVNPIFGYVYAYNPALKRNTPVHRQVWEKHHGPIPAGMVIMHKCDNPCCCNIEHLQMGTQGDNVRDCVAKGRARPFKKLTDEQATYAMARLLFGEKQAAVGAFFGVTQPCMSHLWRGEKWAWLFQ